MSWTTLDLNNLLSGEPLTSPEVLALYENPIAIAQGAAGAPRLYGKAAVPRSQQAELPVIIGVTAANAPVFDTLNYSGDFVSVTGGGTFTSAGTVTIALVSGVLRFRATQGATGALGSDIRIRKNGAVVQTWSIGANQSSVVRQVDIASVPGDSFEWQITNAAIVNMIISASDAYTRIGIPIKVSDL